MKNMKLFPKTFLHCLSLMVGIILVTFLLIYSFLPVFYESYKRRELNADTTQLAEELQVQNAKDISAAVVSYAVSKGYGYTAQYENGEVICSAGFGISFEMVGGDSPVENEEGTISFDVDFAASETKFKTVDGKTVCLTLIVSLQPVGDAVSVLLLILPVVLIVCIMLSVVVAYFYAKSIVKPIQDITAATTRMQSLSQDSSCSVNRGDEIGVLSQNINKMYQKLLSTISDLEQQIQTVGESEREKLDFLLLASHELKTPVTAVRGMVDGMLYNVGVYKDRDTYLAECQKSLENLTELVCRILETSKLDVNTTAKEKEQTDIGNLLQETASPYFMIAKSRNLNMTLSLKDNFSAVVSAKLIKNALSNVLSNAVKYTDTDKSIRIYMKSQTVIVENECQPLSREALVRIGAPFYHPAEKLNENDDSTGLGLYLTERILNACRLSYSFLPYENGMRFVLDFKEE
ncbi:MAG: HAMP domain-containing histidine kinase [Lachnospiraceae bacterium]|jgi:two-component system sensor kinase Ihk|nr:HAMP domain-containing histidine kinase [Lachnospiraceae bacterium]